MQRYKEKIDRKQRFVLERRREPLKERERERERENRESQADRQI